MAHSVVELPPRSPDAELVEGALDRDEVAEAELYRHYLRMAAATAYRLLGTDNDLEDVVPTAPSSPAPRATPARPKTTSSG